MVKDILHNTFMIDSSMPISELKLGASINIELVTDLNIDIMLESAPFDDDLEEPTENTDFVDWDNNPITM